MACVVVVIILSAELSRGTKDPTPKIFAPSTSTTCITAYHTQSTPDLSSPSKQAPHSRIIDQAPTYPARHPSDPAPAFARAMFSTSIPVVIPFKYMFWVSLDSFYMELYCFTTFAKRQALQPARAARHTRQQGTSPCAAQSSSTGRGGQAQQNPLHLRPF